LIATKKIHLSFDYNGIKKRIEIDKDNYSVKKWADFIGLSSASKANPSLEYIIAVAKFTGKPIEWYLYGHSVKEYSTDFKTESSPKDHPSGLEPCPVNCDENLRRLCAEVKKVIGSPWSYAGSLEQNIHSFHEAVEEKEKHKAEMDELRNQFDNLNKAFVNFKKTHSAGQDGGIQQYPAKSTARKRRAGSSI